jgi:hypothetical protein
MSLTAARRQVFSILSDHEPHKWGDVNRSVALTHRIAQRAVSQILRDLIRTGTVFLDGAPGQEPSVRLPGTDSGALG